VELVGMEYGNYKDREKVEMEGFEELSERAMLNFNIKSGFVECEEKYRITCNNF
jgi:hypothetical protein